MPDPFTLSGFLPEGWRSAVWQPFREGVEISPIASGEPAVALLRYAPGAGVPRHRHPAMVGLIVIFSALGGTIGSFLTGLLFDRLPGAVAFYFMLVPAALLAIVLIAIHRRRRADAAA